MTTGELPIAGALTVGAVLAAQPFGLSVSNIMIGSGFAVLGVIGKAAWEIQTGLEAGARATAAGVPQSSLSLRRVLGWVGAGFIGAPFATVMWLIFLRMIGVPADNVAILGLIFLGFLGPKGVTWLVDNTGGLLSKAIGRQGPEGGKSQG